MRNLKINQHGFTLLELLLTAVVISLIGGIGAPVLYTFQNHNNLDIAVVTYAQNLRRAQLLAQGMDGDSSWGVKVQAGSITVFKGSTYASRDTTYDELTSMPNNITRTGTDEVTFSRLTGLPATTANLTLTSVNNETRTITVNAKGMVSY